MKIQTGQELKPIRTIIYGVEGIGKTTIASKFPKPLFIDLEGSCGRYGFDRVEVANFNKLIGTIDEFAKDPSGYKTLVIDTLDKCERLCTDSVLAADGKGKKSLADFAYGKGSVILAAEMEKLLPHLDSVIYAGVHIVLLAHAVTRKFELPEELGTFDKWELKLDKKVCPIFKEWCDLLLFGQYENNIISDQNGKKKAVSSGNRILQTSHAACWDAKNRLGLPETIDFSFEPLAPYFNEQITSVKDYHSQQIEKTVEALDAVTGEDDEDDNPFLDPPKAEKKPSKKKTKDFDDETKDLHATAELALSGLPDELVEKAKKAGVSAADIERVVIARGKQPEGTKIYEYPTDFIDGWLTKWFDKVLEMAKE